MCACLLTWEHKLYYYFDMTIIAPFCTFQHESLRQWILEQYESILFSCICIGINCWLLTADIWLWWFHSMTIASSAAY